MKEKYRSALDESVTQYVDSVHNQHISVMEMLIHENKYLREKERNEKAETESRILKYFEEAKDMGLVDFIMGELRNRNPPTSAGKTDSTENDKRPPDSHRESAEAED